MQTFYISTTKLQKMFYYSVSVSVCNNACEFCFDKKKQPTNAQDFSQFRFECVTTSISTTVP